MKRGSELPSGEGANLYVLDNTFLVVCYFGVERIMIRIIADLVGKAKCAFWLKTGVQLINLTPLGAIKLQC